MTPETVMSIAYQAMMVTLYLGAPLLLTALLIGLLVSLFQAATQINEMTLSFIPKILGVFAVLIAAQMLLSRRRAVSAGDGLPERVPGGVGLAGVGSVIGGISSLFGIGGGSLTVPFLS